MYIVLDCFDSSQYTLINWWIEVQPIKGYQPQISLGLYTSDVDHVRELKIARNPKPVDISTRNT